MGTLTLSSQSDANVQETTVVSDIVLDARSSQQTDVTIDHHGAAQTSTTTVVGGGEGGPSHRKKFDTDLAIVLENVAAGFVRPNVLDVKLGSQLWDESATPSKRARHDQVAAESTSSSLGFRITGMKVWQGASRAGKDGVDKDGYRVYDKMYGRRFTAENVIDGFKSFLLVECAGITKDLGKMLAKRLGAEVNGIRKVLEDEESRMYSASLLFVYEGDGDALKKALDEENEKSQGPREDKPDEEVDEDEEDEGSKVHAVKLIDFAHATWTPGQGPDENALKGVRNVEKILQDLEATTG